MLDFDEEFSCGAHNEEYILKVCEIFYGYIYENKDSFRVIWNSEKRLDFHEELIRICSDYFKKYDRSYFSEDGLDVIPMSDQEKQYWDVQSAYRAIAILDCWVKREFQETPREAIELSYALDYHKKVNIRKK